MPGATIQQLRKEIANLSRQFHKRGWSLATSSNYSARLNDERILITLSGKDKGELEEVDTVLVRANGEPVNLKRPRPSAETLLHCELYRLNPGIRAVLHTHSRYATLLSLYSAAKGQIRICGYEMLKALKGVETHEHTETIPIFPNSQDMKALSQTVRAYLQQHPNTHAFLIAAHGLYTWGENLAEARRHAEALEFLLECEYLRLTWLP